MFALITLQCKCCIMYAEICTIEYFFMCVLVYCTMVVYLCKCEYYYVCIILCLLGMSLVLLCTRMCPRSLRPLPSAATLLSRTLVWLELDELFCHVIVVALGEDAQHRQARLVHVNASAQRHPAGDAAFVGYVLHLQHGHAHSAVLSGKAVVLHTQLQLVALWTDLSAQGAETRITSTIFNFVQLWKLNMHVVFIFLLFLYLFKVFCVFK